MDLKEFIQDQKDLLDDFERSYEIRFRRGKERSMFHSEDDWIALLEEFIESHRGQQKDEAA